ncbi:unnamed protein product [Dimorphilus gyrociliatus]|uniref:Uncharacterized protein n=1 Tax=Dimorphilus gyrociliatus TaxID=2664684 RepID=A0A7I8W8Y1_9ANNE|nr:unnamed protein product [Dimorphilus gyrociliatus]
MTAKKNCSLGYAEFYSHTERTLMRKWCISKDPLFLTTQTKVSVYFKLLNHEIIRKGLELSYWEYNEGGSDSAHLQWVLPLVIVCCTVGGLLILSCIIGAIFVCIGLAKRKRNVSGPSIVMLSTK